MPNICVECDCKKYPIYNYENQTKGVYCNDHKLDGMINVKHKRCVFDGCQTRASCNFKGIKKCLYCTDHKLEGMINIVSERCVFDECKTLATYNFQGLKKGIYCVIHKDDGMIDIKHKRCLFDGCQTRASCNFKGIKKCLYCSKHKLDGMINVVSKTCIDCKKQPYFNYEGQTKGIYCADHKKDGMIDIKNKRCLDCKKQPTYNYEGQTKAIYCNDHKKDGMIDVMNKRCKNEWCQTQIRNNKYDGYCLHCYMNMFPDKPVARNYKTKEQSVVDYIKNKFPNVDWIADKRVDNGCSKRRPDLFLHMGNQILIIEVDENQHNDYNCSCENKRIMELSLDVGHIPIVFIRFNPDMYFKKKKKIVSCWGLNGNGILVIKNKDKWTERLSRLSDVVKYWLENITNKTIETIHLYYDE